MYQPERDEPFGAGEASSLWRPCCVLLAQLLARLCCCLQAEEGGLGPGPSSQQQLLETRAALSHHQPPPQAIEARAAGALAGERLLKGQQHASLGTFAAVALLDLQESGRRQRAILRAVEA
jgi:hypothetical protein